MGRSEGFLASTSGGTGGLTIATDLTIARAETAIRKMEIGDSAGRRPPAGRSAAEFTLGVGTPLARAYR
jgi:hypothetical protein